MARLRGNGSSIFADILVACVVRVARRPAATVALFAVLAALAGGWAATTLRLEGDVTELVDTRASFLADYGTYKAAFPQHRRLNVLVIDADDARRTRLAEAALMDIMRAAPDIFPRVFAPGSDPFLNRHALLYLETDALADLVDDLAAAQPAAAMVALDIPLNVANVIVLPLLLGMGVDNGLHMVGRYRETRSVADVYRSTTPRAVSVSVLTTLFSFVALAFAEHRGMASMGELLAIAIGFLLISTLVVLPALLAWRAKT